ncbi:hypothetical protein C8J57DRAFT_1281382 [Mycena rebaudengoi]|nr:hypothetical protein C8J57DRAFT_1281382 [Mycena rebaudengoi]
MRIEAGAGLLVSFQVCGQNTLLRRHPLTPCPPRRWRTTRTNCSPTSRPPANATIRCSTPSGATPRKRAPPLTEPPRAPQLHTALTAKQHAVLRNAVERLHNCTKDEHVELEMRVTDEQVPARGIATTILQLQPGSASGVKTSSMQGWGISSVGRGCRGEAATQCG